LETSGDLEARKQPGVEREYRTAEIVVYWEPGLCIHTARCLDALPDVFDATRRPWVRLENASADEIADVISRRCPTGALRYERLDGGEQEPAGEATLIDPRPGGPLYLRGRLEIRTADGSIRRLPRAALCRCGGSANKPFCDNTHIRIGFNTRR
jgi:uncharacterized Fe-S cluster protein YjdI